MKLLPAPKINPLNKDAIIDDLKRKLAATECELERYKNLYEWQTKEAYEYWLKLEKYGLQ